MKNRFNSIMIIIVFMCMISSCEKESNVVPDKYAFEGEWNWIETTSGWSPPINPENLGHSISLIIDHTTYTMLVDDMFSEELSYEFKTDTNHFGSIIEYIKLEDGKRFNVYVDSTNLVLSDNLFDGNSWVYVRK